MKRLLFVGGNFGGDGNPSGYIRKLADEIKGCDDFDVTCFNGGTLELLYKCLDLVPFFDVVMWFANVPNDEEKTVNVIKKNNPRVLLVTSKNNCDNKYGYHEIIARMLEVKANLTLVFTKKDEWIQGTVLDPLGNAYILDYPGILLIAQCLCKRMSYLLSVTRVGSIALGGIKEIPNEEAFFSIARSHAEKFHNLIHADNKDRFLGNLSFRCEHGFPSFREGNLIYVSKRNIDKREIDRSGFVAVELDRPLEDGVGYHGDVKPSVDTPVQVALYKYYSNIRYMMHSHVYVLGAEFTEDKVPCGAMEEVESVKYVIDDHTTTLAAVNLRGHGSLVMANDLYAFDKIEYYERTFPEL